MTASKERVEALAVVLRQCLCFVVVQICNILHADNVTLPPRAIAACANLLHTGVTPQRLAEAVRRLQREQQTSTSVDAASPVELRR